MTIKNVLKHKTYAGLIVHNGVENNRWWNRCKQMLSVNQG